MRAKAKMAISATADRARLVRIAFVLEWVTLAWVILEAGVGLWSGWEAHSITLIAFGTDSIIEAISACVLLWRLSVELRDGAAFSERTERKASKVSSGLLFALALYVVGSAAWGLWTEEGQQFSTLGFAFTALTIPVMWVLAKRKITIAEQIGSRALRADAMESVTCGWLSFVVVAGLLAQLVIGAWWIDSVTSLAIVYFLIKEGREAWAAEECGCCSEHCGNSN
jgi:divalent metal cation (Fe/Co/Zn/Cd) transporter